MERYLNIAHVNLRYNLLPHIMLAILMCVLAPCFMGTTFLTSEQVAKIIEAYLSLIGIVLLLPVFIPDMNRDIRDLLLSKRESMTVLQLLRLLQAILILIVVGVLFLLYLLSGSCVFQFNLMLYSFLANAIFLGGMGTLVFAIFDQIAFAYMIPLVYYILCFGGGKRLGNFYLFTMQYNSVAEKKYLLIAGLLMIIGALVARNFKKPIRKNGFSAFGNDKI